MDRKKGLRRGYTTGTCGAAASLAAAFGLLEEKNMEQVEVRLPGGELLKLSVEQIFKEPGRVCCGVKKDAGDDPDVTDGVQILSNVSLYRPKRQGCGWYEDRSLGHVLYLRGAEGIGVVTKGGLSCPVGKSAINPVPRQMIFSHVGQVCEAAGFTGELWIELSALEGEKLAGHTLNERLGIVGGISILGTTGIVNPMSQKALLETIRLEIRQRAREGPGVLILTPGNYGEDFIRSSLGLDLEQTVRCGNFIGASLDMAAEEGIEEVLLIGHGGKLVKLAAGIMNTHSSVADGRMEILAAYGGACGADSKLIERILAAITVDQALDYMDEAPGLASSVMKRVMAKVEEHLKHRAGRNLRAEAIIFTNQRGILGMTSGAKELLTLSGRQRGSQEER